MGSSRPHSIAALFAGTAIAAPALAQPVEADAAPSAALDGYVEVAYSYNLNRPENGITDYRGYDNRHNSFTLSNAVLGGTFEGGGLLGRLALQVGHTPTTYYLGEPSSPGGSGAAATDGSTFKYVQQAYVGYEPPGSDLQLSAGIFLSPIGFEGIAVKDNFNWSRSNLFFGLAAYHTGVKATYAISERVTAMLLVSNGWNSVVDNNDWKSIASQWILTPDDPLTVSVLYFGGPEREISVDAGSVEPWRHLFDSWVQVDATGWLTLALHGDAGFERSTLGTSWWASGAAYARVQPTDCLYVAARGDVFREEAARDETGASAPRLFFPADLVGSGTLTADLRPHDNLSVRLEYRHDQADTGMFFAGDVEGDGTTTPYVHDARHQDTLTVGATGWF